MILPRKWGQGQLFAFSALDGPSYFTDDFTGMLCCDKIGIRFFSKIKRELAIVNVYGRNLEFDAVTSDYIRFHFPEQDCMRIMYAAQHLVVGNVAGVSVAIASTEGKHLTEVVDGAEIHDTQDGDFTALKCVDNRFAFAFGHSKEAVLSLVNEGLAMDLDAVETAKLAFYEEHAIKEDVLYADLYAKCLSVMKTQLYSPEGDFNTIWSTPDRLPHRHLWLWDSVFHALGHRHIGASHGEDLIRAIWVNQADNGFVPHRADPLEKTEITQPPIIGWGVWQLYQTSGNKEFLKSSFENNKAFLNWCRDHRRASDKELYTWETTNDVNCRCDECGMDNSPRFDTRDPLFAIDFSCFMANDVKCMKLIADELGLAEESAFYQNWFEAIAADINDMLWSEEDGFYFDYNIPKQELHKVWSVASFLPIFAGICSEDQAKCLVAHLQDPESFATPFPIPSISMKDVTFGSDMWRGPVWINYNYMIAQGLTAYGYGEFGDEIIDKTIKFMNHWYQLTGTINEFYDCNHVKAPSQLNRKGLPFEPYNINVRLQSIRDYGWSCTLLCDLLNGKLK
jgi:hypothetical protein